MKTSYISGVLHSSQGNYGLVVVPATASGLVTGSNPLSVRLAETQVNLTGDVNLDVSAFISGDSSGTDIDGAVTSYEGRNLPNGPSIDAIVSQDSASSGQYLLVDSNKYLYTKNLDSVGISSNIELIQKDIFGMSSNIQTSNYAISSALAHSSNRMTWGTKLTDATSGSLTTNTLSMALMPISGHLNLPIGAIAACMYKWEPVTSIWTPYTG